MNKIIPIILCGGSGNRLWPFSREGYPKQFIDLVGDQTLFERTFLRIINSIGKSLISKVLIVTNEHHRYHVLDQLNALDAEISVEIIVEPASKNTAPALIMASLIASENAKDNIIVVTPADQIIIDEVEFKKSLSLAIDEASNDSIVTLGITPDRPETGYGYIKYKKNVLNANLYSVVEFKEKPNSETAKQYIEEGSYLWNSGLFILKTDICNKAFSHFASDLFEKTKIAINKSSKDQFFTRPNKDLFMQLKSDSIDYSLMEKCSGSDSIFPIKTIKLNANWSDLGSWKTLWALNKENNINGNDIKGDAIAIDTHNSLIYSDKRLVVTLGIENIIVVETSDSILVADMKESSNLKKVTDIIKSRGRSEHHLHTKVYRPWGWYDSLENDDGFQVKRINVKPGAKLSLQSHKFRSEHWTVIKGTGEVTVNDNISILSVNESIYIPLGAKHRLCNPGIDDLEIIEVQVGSYLGEDDIERYDDTYGRLSDD